MEINASCVFPNDDIYLNQEVSYIFIGIKYCMCAYLEERW